MLKSDFPERVKARVYLAARGALRGRRLCLLCPRPGFATRVHVPVEALRLADPVLDHVRVYWLCVKCAELEPEDPQIVEALQGTAKPQGKRQGEGKEAEAQRYEQGTTP